MTDVFEALKKTILDDLDARDRKGYQEYSKDLYTFDGRDTGEDLYEELLDAIVYTKKLRLELEQAKKDIKWMDGHLGMSTFISIAATEYLQELRQRWFGTKGPVYEGEPEPPKKPKVIGVSAKRVFPHSKDLYITLTLDDGEHINHTIVGHDDITSALIWLAEPPTKYDWSAVV